MAGAITMLAHQGGWDEALLVATPIALFVFLLRIANQRAAKLADQADQADQTQADQTQAGRSGGNDDEPSSSSHRTSPAATASDRTGT